MSHPLIKEKTHLSWQNKHSSEESIHEEGEKRCRAGWVHVCVVASLQIWEGMQISLSTFLWNVIINKLCWVTVHLWMNWLCSGGVATVPTHPTILCECRWGSAQGNVKSEMRSHEPHMCCPLTGPHTPWLRAKRMIRWSVNNREWSEWRGLERKQRPGEGETGWWGKQRGRGQSKPFCFSHRWKDFVISVWKGRVKVTQGV